MKYLLDTNTCIAAMRNHPQVLERLSAVTPDDCAVSAITAYELFTGVEKCGDPPRERPKVERLLSMVGYLSFDSAAAVESARIRGLLEARGEAIGPYDTLLAGHAVATQLILVTNNQAEFMRVPGLPVENWQSPPATS